MKKNMENKKENKSFLEITEGFAISVAQWQRKKSARRNAFMLLCDHDEGQWRIFTFGNRRAKHHLPTCLHGLAEAMKKCPELLGWIKAYVRYAERELKREREANGQDKSTN